MSLSTEIKDSILAESGRRPCCRRALLRGALFARGVLAERSLRLRVGSLEIARFLAALVAEIFSKEAQILPPERGGRGCILSFRSPAAERWFSALGDAGAQSLPYRPECGECTAAFLSGMFLVSGRISDPQKAYSLELSVAGREEQILAVLASFGLSPRHTRRGNESVIYFHTESDVEDLLTRAGFDKISMRIMEVRNERDMRRDINRTRNIETFNISKAIDLSVAQVAKIRRLDELGMLGNLPDVLEKTARLRMENESLSLAQLAAIMTPPITRAGLSRRMQEIMKIADELLMKP